MTRLLLALLLVSCKPNCDSPCPPHNWVGKVSRSSTYVSKKGDREVSCTVTQTCETCSKCMTTTCDTSYSGEGGPCD